MTTKEYLNQISRLNRMINNKLSELTELKELSKSISAVSNKERVQTSMERDKIGNTLSKIDEMEREIDKMIDSYSDKRTHIIGQIDSMEDENSYDILFSRYIEKKTFEKIADTKNYSFRQIIRLHGIALKQFEEKYGSEYMS